MKRPKLFRTALYWRVVVHPTMQEEVFSAWPECVAWMRKVQHTPQSDALSFEVIHITERSGQVPGHEVRGEETP